MLHSGDPNITIHQGCREGCIADILGFGLDFNYRIKVGAAKDNAAVRFGRTQCEINFFTGVKAHTSGTYGIF